MVSAETHAKVEQMWRDEVEKNKRLSDTLIELANTMNGYTILIDETLRVTATKRD